MLASNPVIQGNKRYLNCLCTFFPFYSGHSDEKLWYISCSPPAFIGWSQRAAPKALWSQYNFATPLHVTNFMVNLLVWQKVSSNCRDTIWYYVTSKLP